MSSPAGPPIHTLKWAIGRLIDDQIKVISCSPFYCTRPVYCSGSAERNGQQDYINAVIRVQTPLSAGNLLKRLKQIEKAAGRNIAQLRTQGHWGSRPLDLDIVDYKGIVSKSFTACSREMTRVPSAKEMRLCHLVLPHPRAHLRPFVMRPLMDIEPLWHHPVSGRSARSLWALLRNSAGGQILHRLD